MANLTIRMDPEEKRKLAHWAEGKGQTVTAYIKDLVAADMEAGSPGSRAEAWMREHGRALEAEARLLERDGVPGAGIALRYPGPDADV